MVVPRSGSWWEVWEVLRDFERGVVGYAVCPMPTTKQCFLNNSILSIPRASDAVTSLGRQQNRETSLPKSLNTSQKIPKIPMSNTRSTSLHPGTPRFRLGKPWAQYMRQHAVRAFGAASPTHAVRSVIAPHKKKGCSCEQPFWKYPDYLSKACPAEPRTSLFLRM